MSFELTLLLWSVVLHLAYLGTQSALFRVEFGVELANGPRDNEPASHGMAGRAERAFRNFMETYPVFVALTLLAHVTGGADALTWWGALVWFVARIAYLPLYLSGIPYMRSLAWAASMVGLILLFVGVLA